MAHFGDLISSKVSSIKSKVGQTIQSISGDQSSHNGHPLDDDQYRATFQKFLYLSKSLTNLGTNVKESMEAMKKLCTTNGEMANLISGDLASNVQKKGIQESADRFAHLHSTIVNSYLQDFMMNSESEILKVIIKEKENDPETKMLLEERRRTLQEYDQNTKSLHSSTDPEKTQQYQKRVGIVKSRHTNQNEHLIEHLTQRNERLSNLIGRITALVMQIQHDFFTGAAGLFNDMSSTISSQLKELSLNSKSKPNLEQNESNNSHSHSQPNISNQQKNNHSSPQVAKNTTTSPSVSATAKARETIFTDDLFNNNQVSPSQNANRNTVQTPVQNPTPVQNNPPVNLFDSQDATPLPVQTQSPQSQVHQPQSNSMFVFDLAEEELISMTGEKPMNPVTQNGDMFSGFNTSPAPASSSTPNIFDEIDSLGPKKSNQSSAQTSSTSSPANRAGAQYAPKPSDPFGDIFGFANTSQGSSTTASPQVSNRNNFGGNANNFGYSQNQNSMNNLNMAPDPDSNLSTTKKADDMVEQMRAKETAKELEHEQRRQMDDFITSRVNAWAGGRKGNLRALLSTLHTLLGEESGWKEISLGDLIQPNRVRVSYKKALLVVHPDKLNNKSVEDRFIAERVFELLTEAYKKEEATLS